MNRDQSAHRRFVESCLATERKRGPFFINLTASPAVPKDLVTVREHCLRMICEGLPLVYTPAQREETR